MDPFVAFCEWYDTLSSEVRSDIEVRYADLMSSDAGIHKANFDPDYDNSVILDECTAAFHYALFGPKSSPSKVVGALLSIRTCINYCFSDRFTAEGWEKMRAENLQAVEDGLEDAETVERVLATFDERSKEWIEIGKRWKELCTTDLSDQALNDCLMPQ